ncbi:maleylpyruvate isomerase family mycothiol-dependent enzyme [Actinocatenispora rupis]|uniref:maleylpyruvate isomerase family mycothiol-dependent enzyme n=1 Tax=Actinocatenispora rupis TaxID=519421 RepID=UPI0019456988|nr:maleylpyruvate isomerase family mycothiol-dependent enzyme [Actinocatenispora rupis]
MSDERGARLLLTERDAIVPVLRRTPVADLDRPTVCTGWSVRDVLAHCAAALHRLATGDLHSFGPADNERDVEARRALPATALLDELSDAYEPAARVIAAGAGRYDGFALGEWIHGGDVRLALGLPDPYASDGLEDALALVVALSRYRRTAVPHTLVTLPDRTLDLGTPGDAEPATLHTDPATLVRVVSGRPADPADYRLTGATPDQYRMLG